MTSKFLLLRLVRWLGFSEVGISARAIARSSAKKPVRESSLNPAIQSTHASRSTATKLPFFQPV